MSLLTNKPVCYLHSHFTNLHFVGCWTYRLTPWNHVSNSVILLRTRSIILIQSISIENYYNNGGLRMNPLLIFGSASVTCSFKLQGAIWSSLISGTGSSIVLGNFMSQEKAWCQASLNFLCWWNFAIPCGSRHCLNGLPPPSHSIVPPSPSDAEDYVHTYFQHSHPTNISPLNFCANLVVSPSSSHMQFSSTSLFTPGVPLDDIVLCTPIIESSLVVNEE